MSLTYSVAIRTLGRAGEKYNALLESIRRSSRAPEKVVVVLPEGVDPPRERLGCEEFVFCEKSMIGQRIAALPHISSDCTLFLDDDVAFDENFVAKLLEPIEQGLFDCAIGPLFSFFPRSRAGALAGFLMGSPALSLFRRDYYVKILRDGGWSYHTFDTSVKRYYPTESFAWTLFLIRTDVMRALRMEDEQPWLERFGYACGDDRVMAYKLVKMGYSACCVSNALYTHNDARTSTAGSGLPDTTPSFCMTYMHRVFWQRFIQDLEKNPLRRAQNRACLCYYEAASALYRALKSLSPRNRPYNKAAREGFREGARFTRGEEYAALPPISGKEE